MKELHQSVLNTISRGINSQSSYNFKPACRSYLNLIHQWLKFYLKKEIERNLSLSQESEIFNIWSKDLSGLLTAVLMCLMCLYLVLLNIVTLTRQWRSQCHRYFLCDKKKEEKKNNRFLVELFYEEHQN